MKKTIVLMVVLGLVLTAGIVSAGKFMECRCWRLKPYTDTIKICNPTGDPLAPNFYPAVVVGSWIIDVSGGTNPNPHKLLIPLTGTIQKDLSGKYALELQGTARDLTFQTPWETFSYPCYIQALLKGNFESASFPYPPPNGPLKSSVSAWCEDYFGDNPFITPNYLVPISCYDPPILNPINGGENLNDMYN